MDWKVFWNTAANKSKNPIAQVQRKNGEDIALTVAHIIDNLAITSTSDVLDVCCGNGLLTSAISQTAKSVMGIDLSKNQIAIAKLKFNTKNINYRIGSALSVSKLMDQKFDKIYLQFSFQYFDKKGEGEKVISEMLQLLKSNGKIFIGDIPKYEKRFAFYNTLQKKFFLLTSKLKGTNPMGKFWKPTELNAICAKYNVKGTYLEQPKNLPNAWYRFDYLIEK